MQRRQIRSVKGLESIEKIVENPELEHKEYLSLSYEELETIDDAESKLQRGHRLITGFPMEEDFYKGQHLILEAACAGHPLALGLSFAGKVGMIDGRVRRDLDKGFKLLRESAEREHPLAQYNLAFCYMHQVGAQKGSDTFVHILKYFELAANQGFAPAQFDVGLLYKAKKNHDLAIKYFRLALDGGYENAKSQLSELQNEISQKNERNTQNIGFFQNPEPQNRDRQPRQGDEEEKKNTYDNP